MTLGMLRLIHASKAVISPFHAPTFVVSWFLMKNSLITHVCQAGGRDKHRTLTTDPSS